MTAPPPNLTRRLVCSLLPTVLLLTVGELGARVYYFLRHGRDVQYLIMPFGKPRPQPPASYPYKPNQTYTKTDWCSGRQVTYTINSYGGRGGAWSVEKSPGTIRIIALGASTTFGVNNPDSATWPAYLQAALRDQGVPAEVLNVGIPGIRIEELLQDLPKRVLPFHPDVVIFYEAFNNATAHRDLFQHADVSIERFHLYSGLGRLAVWLHYRSMLYTALLEKTHFALAKRSTHIVAEARYFEQQVTRLIRELRHHQILPVLALQVSEAPLDPTIQRLTLEDSATVERTIAHAAEHCPVNVDERAHDPRFTALRAYQTQLLVEVARRVAEAERVQVIDPRPSFAQISSEAPLFCDVIHLTDTGNERLARMIAERLDLSVPLVRLASKRRVASTSVREGPGDGH